ncbi:retrovirus-related pol polyprotein from transposon TNT 1-94 [Tanacetum coccineum]|uniref:Retrovirus-related pol polyprotein from transposon TNT 1-94 n=1 Tax=Tanacetum coccineum TaxID=301880 RepID=A0ABQ4XI26_9ASTR
MYDSWASRIRLFIKGKKHGRLMLDSIDNGPLVYPTVEENGQTRPIKYFELTEAQQLQDDCDVQATNIILYGLPPDMYALVNHQEAAKDILDKVKMLMKGTDLSYQEHECILYNLFDKFAHVLVNTKFLNALLSEWSKFVTDVKLAKSLYTTNYDQLYAYLSQHERHANEVREDPIECINKAMAFLSVVASRFPLSNNQLRTSSNPRNQATIQDGRFTIQQVQGRQIQSYAGTGNIGIATTSKGNVAVGPSRVVKCYNCQGEGHMERQCTQPKRPRNAVWFKEKLMLAEAQEAGQILDEEQLTFLAETCVIAKEHAVISMNDDEETLILEEESRSKMLDKQNDPISIEKKIKISPIDYSKLNKIKEDFGKCFVTNKELSAKQAFWLKHSTLSKTPVTSHTPVRIEAPSELPKSQENDTIIRKLKEIIKSLSRKDNMGNVKKDIDEIETINIELKHSVAKLLSENENLRKEREHLTSIFKDQFDSIGKTHVQSKEHCNSLIDQINAKSIENSDLNAQLQEKVFAITTLKNELRKLKGKNVVNTNDVHYPADSIKILPAGKFKWHSADYVS